MTQESGSSSPSSGSSGGGKNVLVPFSVMMFLQFFVWGAWYVSQPGFLNKNGLGALIGTAYTVGPIAALISPLFLGLIADRFMPTQRALGILHILGGLIMFAVPGATQPLAEGQSPFFHPYIILIFLHMLCYMPTLALTASMPMSHMTAPEKQFPVIRVLGTIGWIVGNIVVAGSLGAWGINSGQWIAGGDQSSAQFFVTGGAGVALGIYSFFLPHTPPPAKGKPFSIREAFGLDSMRMLAKPAYAVFMLCSFLICIPLAAYYQRAQEFVTYAGFESPTGTMSFGQMAEIVFMILMPLFFVRLGVKYMLAIGMLAWVVRYALFSLGADAQVQWMVIGGIVLHGICYDFFFVTGMIYAEKSAEPSIRGQAQGFLVLVTQGLGLGIGAQIVQSVVNANKPAGAAQPDWQMVWFICGAMAFVVMIAFLLLFKDKALPARSGAGSANP